MRWRHCDRKTLASGERSKSIPLKRERPRRHLKLQGPLPSSPQKKKANTTPPLTPSPPPNKRPFPQPTPFTSPPPYQGKPRPLPLSLPSPPPRSPTIYPPPYTLPMPHLTSHTTSLQPTSSLTNSPPHFPLLSTIPFPPSTTTTPTQTSPPLHRLHRQHPPSRPVGTLHTGPLHC